MVSQNFENLLINAHNKKDLITQISMKFMFNFLMHKFLKKICHFAKDLSYPLENKTVLYQNWKKIFPSCIRGRRIIKVVLYEYFFWKRPRNFQNFGKPFECKGFKSKVGGLPCANFGFWYLKTLA